MAGRNVGKRYATTSDLCHGSPFAAIMSGVPSKSRPEDIFIEAFLSAYDDLSWADADKDWVDRRVDGGVEMLATRKSDGKTLAIEHTLIQPFVGDINDFKFFERAFLKIEDDKSLIVPDRWIQVFVPIRTLDPFPKAAARAVVVKAVHEWIRANRFHVRDGEHQYECQVIGVPGVADFEITLTIKAQELPEHGQLNVRRQQVGNDFGDVVRRALSTKLPKLTRQQADKRVLILERRHMNLVPKQILDEIKKQAPSFPQLAAVDETWILETIGYEPGGHFLFELNDDNDEHVATLTFQNGIWTSRSGKDGIPICNN
jgi:hypothetical protein